ncbi:MAG: TIGR04283 family arsenosugar biosynthesis glycosyltransferase [Mucilaginibacter sp.]|uniref:TIGR04283 family arsenosugar biosynthesis glycosyltransferase n=1 Tax=Mucilaginibacter sp. TaxID=1882438 RepID=UPI0034E42563
MISVIIPTFNEAKNIGKLIEHLSQNQHKTAIEIIVSDGGSTDATLAIAATAGAKTLLSPQKGRAAQMDFAASQAKGNVLYFVHADTKPPVAYFEDIKEALLQGYDLGRYLSKYDSKSWLLKLNAALSRLDVFAGMGGDQTLFIIKELYQQIGGFNTDMKIMEEFEFCARARKNGKYKIIKKPVLISARKYETNSWLKVQIANYTIIKMYRKGASQQTMIDRYKQMLQPC